MGRRDSEDLQGSRANRDQKVQVVLEPLGLLVNQATWEALDLKGIQATRVTKGAEVRREHRVLWVQQELQDFKGLPGMREMLDHQGLLG